MDFPSGSLVTLLCLILIVFGFFSIEPAIQRFLALGLLSILLGEFLVIPLPGPKGIQVNLNVGQTLIPVVLVVILWIEAPVEDRYRSSLGILALGLTLYGISALLDLEPGLFGYPLLFAVPVTIAIAALTGRTVAATTMGIIGGCTLVTIIRYFETIFFMQPGAVLEIPGSLLWNTMSLSAFASAGILWGWEQLKGTLRSRGLVNSTEEPPLIQTAEIEPHPEGEVDAPDSSGPETL